MYKSYPSEGKIIYILFKNKLQSKSKHSAYYLQTSH